MQSFRSAWRVAMTGAVFLALSGGHLFADATISIRADQPGVAISSNLFGLFFEEINHGGDGGLYAEMVRNGSFEPSYGTSFWTAVATGTATAQFSTDTTQPLNASNPTALQVVRSAGTGNAGVANGGFWGMSFRQGQVYDLSFYARVAAGFAGAVVVQLQSADGSQLYSQQVVSGLTTGWQRFTLPLVTGATDANGRLAISLSQPGTLWLDSVSLFPRQTFRGRPNGMRPDLAEMLVDLRPAFMRFPGGCFVEGDTLANAFRWKNTIGDLSSRPGHWNGVWGYRSTDGLGYHEYLQLCEDLGAEPLFVINCGMSHNGVVPLAEMGPWVQDALDAIEYANGPTNSTWGAQRAANGHPAPFGLKYLEIGNENGGADYNDRYALFYDAVKTSYPGIHLISCMWGGTPTSRPNEIIDEHYYSDAAFFINNATKYDGYSRSGPKVYVGEYAVTSGSGGGNLRGALGEAAFMTGLERNADIVVMSSYAPLFANVNNRAWNPDLIYYDSSRAYGQPSYHVQKMFAQNRGDVVLPLSLSVSTAVDPAQAHQGAIGVGSWNTSVQYTNLVVTSNGVPVYQSDFSSGAPGWQALNGTWSAAAGCYQQTALVADCRSVTGNTNWAGYTLSLRARKVSGSEGFLILFNWLDNNNWTWWNIGGWNNTRHALEYSVNGSKTQIGAQVAGSVEANRWYDIRIELSTSGARCYLDNVLIHDLLYPVSKTGAVGLGTWNTTASFTNVVVARAGATLYQSDFTSGAPGWRVSNGSWTTDAETYRQTAAITDCRSTTGSTNWSDYTLTLRARKDSGSEGFLILFNWLDNNNWTWWNIGGWNNTRHGLEACENGVKTSLGTTVNGGVTSGSWYDIRVELAGTRIRCYLNNALVHDVSYPSTPPMVASASYHRASGQIILKAVNVSADPINAQLAVEGIANLGALGSAVTLTSPSPTDENSLAQPTRVYPATTTISNVAPDFGYAFPANSLTVLRLQTPPPGPPLIRLDAGTNQTDLAALVGGIPVRLSSFITNTVSVDYTLELADGAVLTGTVHFKPGDLVKYIPLPAAASAPGAFLRVTLANAVNGSLGSVPHSYFSQPPADGLPPQLGWFRFPDETLVYWTDPACVLMHTTNLAGGWITLTNVPSPVRLDFAGERGFYRLKR